MAKQMSMDTRNTKLRESSNPTKKWKSVEQTATRNKHQSGGLRRLEKWGPRRLTGRKWKKRTGLQERNRRTMDGHSIVSE